MSTAVDDGEATLSPLISPSPPAGGGVTRRLYRLRLHRINASGRRNSGTPACAEFRQKRLRR